MFTELITQSLPKFSTLRANKKTTVWFRPILVKEEKKLLAAQELGTKKEIIKAVEEVIDSCFENIVAKKLPTFEFDYLFVQLRCKSIAESISARLICPETEEKINLNVDLTKIQIVGFEQYNPHVKISNNLQFSFRLPTYEDVLGVKSENEFDNVIEIATNCIEEITTPTEVYTVSQSNKNDISEMFMNLTPEQFKKIIDFFDTIPKYEMVYNYQTSDGVDRSVIISGIEDFFTLASVT
jgi:hypothetical protein